MSSDHQAQINRARETMDDLFEISNILNTQLDRQTLSICVEMCEKGVNPEALAAVIKELYKESSVISNKSSR